MRESTATRLVWVVFGLAVAYTIGLSLVGEETYLGTDQLLVVDPWRSEYDQSLIETRPPVSDTYDQLHTDRELFAEAARDGDLALWNPYSAGGAPLAAEPIRGNFSPLETPFLVLPAWYAAGVVALLVYLVVAVSTFNFLRLWGVSRAGAAIAGIAGAFNGFLFGWANWTHQRTAACIPLLFWAVERLLQRRDARSVAFVAVAFASMIFGGFPAVAGFALYLLAAYVVVRLWPEIRARRTTDLARRAGLLVGAGLLGAMITAIQVLPFVQRLSEVTDDRAQSPDDRFDVVTALFTVFPNALGGFDGITYFGPSSHPETMAYLGSAAVALCLVAVWRPLPEAIRPGLRGFTLGALGVIAVLMYGPSPFIAAAQQLPVFADNRVTRILSVFLFVASLLVGIGVDAARSSQRRPRRELLPVAGALGLGLFVAALYYVQVPLRTAWDRGVGATVLKSGLSAAAIGLLVLGVVALVRWRPKTAAVAPVVFALLVGVQGAEASRHYLPQPDADLYFPETETHRFLEAKLDGQRVATVGTTLRAGSTIHYGIRTVTGHTFYRPTWKDALLAVDPLAFTYDACIASGGEPEDCVARTNPTLRYESRIAEHPVLDRLGAKYYVAPLGVFPLGVDSSGDFDGFEDFPGGATISSPPVEVHRLRGALLRLESPLFRSSSDDAFELRVIDDETDEVLATSRRRIGGGLNFGWTPLPVAAEAATEQSRLVRLEIELDSASSASIGVRDGRPLIRWTEGRDTLELVHVAGAQTYVRTNALPRIRWADEAVVIDDARERLDRLSDGVDAGTVVLSSPTEHTGGGDAGIDIVRDGLDEIVVRVDADGPGWLVLADALQDGWSATVDGSTAALVDADHAGVAVEIPSGVSTVVVRYDEPAYRLGRTVTVLGLLGVAILAIGGERLRRLTGRRVADPAGRDDQSGDT